MGLRFPSNEHGIRLETPKYMKLESLLKKVGTNIREARLRAGLRQVDVHERAGLTYRHYQNIEAGRINVTISTLCRLAHVLKARVHELIGDC